MTNILSIFLKLGLWLSIAGIAVCFSPITNIITGFILAIIALIYTLWAMFTANRPTGYNTHKECLADIIGDLTLYSLLLIGIFLWSYIPTITAIPITPDHYYIALTFLIVMTLISFTEMIITIRSSLIAMERQNPISIVRGE